MRISKEYIHTRNGINTYKGETIVSKKDVGYGVYECKFEEV